MTLPERQVVSVRNPNDGEPLDVSMADAATASNQQAMIRALNGFMPAEYDQMLFSYTGDDMTAIEIRKDGKTMAIIQMTYANHRLMSVYKQ